MCFDTYLGVWGWRNDFTQFMSMCSPCSPVVANIYMEYFKDMALGPELPLPIKEW